MKIWPILEETLQKQKLNFSRSALSQAKDRANPKYPVTDCSRDDDMRVDHSDVTTSTRK